MSFNVAAFRKFSGTPKRPLSSPEKTVKEENQDDKQAGQSNKTESPQKVDKTDITCVPGDRLCKAGDKTIPGSGTYKNEDFIYASLAGRVVISYPNTDVKFIGVEGLKKSNRNPPAIDDLVTVLVNSLQTPNMASCSIWSVNSQVLRQPFKAMIAKEDIPGEHYCEPGDVLICKVVGVGDAGLIKLKPEKKVYSTPRIGID